MQALGGGVGLAQSCDGVLVVSVALEAFGRLKDGLVIVAAVVGLFAGGAAGQVGEGQSQDDILWFCGDGRRW